jgi:hypothetical protein
MACGKDHFVEKSGNNVFDVDKYMILMTFSDIQKLSYIICSARLVELDVDILCHP